MSDRDSFTFYRKWHKLVANCDEKTQANIYKAIVDYVFSDTIPTDPTSQLMFSLIKQKLDEDAQRQAKTSKMRMRAALKKWGNSEEEIRKKLMQMQKKPCKCNETDANAENTMQMQGNGTTNNIINNNDNNNNDNNISTTENDANAEKTMQMQKKPCKCNETDANALQKRKKQFYEELIPYLSLYSAEMLRDFYEYWTEPNKSKTKFRKEMEKTWDTSRRLRTWAKQENKFGKYGCNTSNQSTREQRERKVAELIARRLERNKPFEG